MTYRTRRQRERDNDRPQNNNKKALRVQRMVIEPYVECAFEPGKVHKLTFVLSGDMKRVIAVSGDCVKWASKNSADAALRLGGGDTTTCGEVIADIKNGLRTGTMDVLEGTSPSSIVGLSAREAKEVREKRKQDRAKLGEDETLLGGGSLRSRMVTSVVHRLLPGSQFQIEELGDGDCDLRFGYTEDRAKWAGSYNDVMKLALKRRAHKWERIKLSSESAFGLFEKVSPTDNHRSVGQHRKDIDPVTGECPPTNGGPQYYRSAARRDAVKQMLDALVDILNGDARRYTYTPLVARTIS